MGDARMSATGATRPSLWLSALLVSLAALGPFSLNIFKPCLPWIREDLATPIEVIQLALSLSIFIAAIATVFAGYLADRYSRRHVLVTCLSLFIAGSLMCALAHDAGMMVLGRTIQAAAGSVLLVLARAVIHDLYGEGESGTVIARTTFVVVLSVLLAPALGGMMIEWVSWRTVFLLTLVIGGLLLWAALHSLAIVPQPVGETQGISRGRLRNLLRSGVFYGFAMQSACHFAIFFAYSSAASYIMVDQLNRPASEYGLWFILMAIFAGAGLWLAGQLNNRIASGPLACVGSTIVCLSCLVSAWILAQPDLTPLRLFLAPCLGAFGIGLALPGTNAGVMEVDPALAGTASGILGFLQMAIAALFSQWVVHNEAQIALTLAQVAAAGGICGLAFSLMSINHGAGRYRAVSADYAVTV